ARTSFVSDPRSPAHVPSPQRPDTREIACSKRPVSAGPATAQIRTTSPAVIKVTRTHPGTSPRSSSASARASAVAAPHQCRIPFILTPYFSDSADAESQDKYTGEDSEQH